MLKELNKLWVQTQRQAATWRRWARKLPHNRVARPRLRDERGRVVGYGPPVPLPEPPLPGYFCKKVPLPSGRVEVVLSGAIVEAAYRVARHPAPSPDAGKPLPLSEAEVRRMYAEYCGG